MPCRLAIRHMSYIYVVYNQTRMRRRMPRGSPHSPTSPGASDPQPRRVGQASAPLQRTCAQHRRQGARLRAASAR